MSTDVFILHSQYTPAGDQPEAIARLIAGVEEGAHHQTLKGITGLHSKGKRSILRLMLFIMGIINIRDPRRRLLARRVLGPQYYAEQAPDFQQQQQGVQPVLPPGQVLAPPQQQQAVQSALPPGQALVPLQQSMPWSQYGLTAPSLPGPQSSPASAPLAALEAGNLEPPPGPLVSGGFVADGGEAHVWLRELDEEGRVLGDCHPVLPSESESVSTRNNCEEKRMAGGRLGYQRM